MVKAFQLSFQKFTNQSCRSNYECFAHFCFDRVTIADSRAPSFPIEEKMISWKPEAAEYTLIFNKSFTPGNRYLVTAVARSYGKESPRLINIIKIRK